MIYIFLLIISLKKTFKNFFTNLDLLETHYSTQYLPSTSSIFIRSPTNSLRSSSLNSSTFSSASNSKSHRLSYEELFEMRRLSAMLPNRMQSINRKHSIDPIQLINNTVQYITQLSATVMARVQNGTLPKGNLKKFFFYFVK